MERGYSSDFTNAADGPMSSPTSASAPVSASRLNRQRGVVIDLNQILGDGVIQQGEQLLSFRAIDLIGSQAPQIGDEVSFGLVSGAAQNRAIQVVLDSNPQFIPGQGSLQECYQLQAERRAAQMADRQQREQALKASLEDRSDSAPKYWRCEDCQKLVLPKLRRNRNKLRIGTSPWLHFCPLCKGSLDHPPGFIVRHPVLLMVLLAALFSWWRW